MDLNPPPQDQRIGNILELSPQRVTAQDVEKARAEKEAAFIKLMDDMQASVETQGQWFVQLGQKKPITETQPVTTSGFMGLGIGKKTTDQEHIVGYNDDRALVLKAQTARQEYSSPIIDFTVVTRDGIFVIPFYKNEIDNPQSADANNTRRDYDILIALTSGKQTPDNSSRYDPHGTSYSAAIVSSHAFDSTKEGQTSWSSFITLKHPSDTGMPFEDFQIATKASIDLTESPHKQNMQQAVQQTQVASNAANMIQNLPPR